MKTAQERPLHFIRAIQDQPLILQSLLEWLDSERDKLLEELAIAEAPEAIHRLQGRVRQTRTIRTLLEQMRRPKADAA